MAGETSYVRVVVVSFLLATVGTVKGQVCPGTQTDSGCYVIREASKTRAEAENDCISRGAQFGRAGHLVALTTKARNDELNGLLTKLYQTKSTDAQRSAVQAFWIGGYEESAEFGSGDFPIWRWLDGMTPLEKQGCFNDDPRDTDMPDKKTFREMFIANCTSYCKTKGRTYAGLQGGVNCFCGDSYGKYGATSGCTNICEGMRSNRFTTKEYCGGSYKSSIYKLNGAYSKWSYDQPNNFDKYQACGALESRTSWGMGDEPCFRSYPYICQLPLATCPPNAWMVEGRCLVLEIDASKTWFAARGKCKSLNGDLVSVNSKELHEEIATKLALSRLASIHVWIGLIGKQWLWSTGEAFLHSNWEPDEPDNFDKNCMIFDYNYKGVYWWKDEKCSKKLPYVCYMEGQIGPLTPRPTTTAPSTISLVKLTTTPSVVTVRTTNPTDTSAVVSRGGGEFTTPASTTSLVTSGLPSTPPTTRKPTSRPTSRRSTPTTTTPSLIPNPPVVNNTQPNAGASTANSGFSTIEIVLLAVLGLVLLVVFIVIVCCCCYFKKANECFACCTCCTGKKERTVYPQKTADLRNQVLLPYSEYYGNSPLNGDYSPAGSATGLILNAGTLPTRTPSEENVENQYMTYRPSGMTQPASHNNQTLIEVDSRAEKKRKKKAKRYSENVTVRQSNNYEELNPVESPVRTSMHRISLND